MNTTRLGAIGTPHQRRCAARRLAQMSAPLARLASAESGRHRASGCAEILPLLCRRPVHCARQCSSRAGRLCALRRAHSGLFLLVATAMPVLAFAQASPFLTGATALESNILAWLTPIAVILVMVLGAMAMANRISWGWCIGAILGIAQVSALYGSGDAQTIVENCGNTLILRCSASEHGGTARFCSRLIGEREVVRRTVSRARDGSGKLGGGAHGTRRSVHVGEQRVTEAAVLPSQIEQLADLEGFLKTAASASWLRVRLHRPV